MSRRWFTALAVAAAGMVVGTVLLAGPPDPPDGPVGPTYKTLAEVEPRIAINETNTPGDEACLFRITRPGSYYLTGDVTGVAGRHGIVIESGVVTIDLMGFALLGLEESGAGIIATDPFGEICVRNGVVTMWGGGGIQLGAGGRGFVVEGVRASSNGAEGIRVGAGAVVRGCSAIYNLGTGIGVAEIGVIESCAAKNNGGGGVETSTGCVIRGCASAENAGAGFIVESGGTISDCSATQNEFVGIMAGAGATVTRCSAAFNDGDGVWVGGNSMILENTCTSNGRGGDGAGIHALGACGRIEGNTVGNNPRGIDVDAGRNMVVRNYATQNGVNYDITGGNIVGTIVTGESAMNAAANANVNISF
jgi:hypothetical protein